MLIYKAYNQNAKWKSFLIAMINLSSGITLLILCCSLNKPNAMIPVISPEQDKFINSKDSSEIQIQTSGFFRKVFYGNGLDHMNINLVEINVSGLKPGDEIGVFDGIYCVGSLVIEPHDMLENNLSIAASANDTIESNPNGYIVGHKVSLQVYRNGVIYQLFFQTVNDTQDIFERWASMFALVDFSKSQAIAEP